VTVDVGVQVRHDREALYVTEATTLNHRVQGPYRQRCSGYRLFSANNVASWQLKL